jgi:alpha-L-fucosidase
MTVVAAKDGGWSYRPDGKVKSFETCLKYLIGCAVGDGNLLLDIGPDSTGVIPEEQAVVLRQMGAWLQKYGESIYGTRGGPYLPGAWGGATYNGRQVYLHVSKWHGEQIALPPMKSKIISSVCLTATNALLKVEQTDKGTVVTLPEEFQDPVDTVIRITLSAPASEEMPSGNPLKAIELQKAAKRGQPKGQPSISNNSFSP